MAPTKATVSKRLSSLSGTPPYLRVDNADRQMIQRSFECRNLANSSHVYNVHSLNLVNFCHHLSLT